MVEHKDTGMGREGNMKDGKEMGIRKENQHTHIEMRGLVFITNYYDTCILYNTRFEFRNYQF